MFIIKFFYTFYFGVNVWPSTLSDASDASGALHHEVLHSVQVLQDSTTAGIDTFLFSSITISFPPQVTNKQNINYKHYSSLMTYIHKINNNT